MSFYRPISGYDLIPAPVPASGYDGGAESGADNGYNSGEHFGATAYEQDVVEALRGQGLLDDQQAQALLEGIGRGAAAWNVATGQQPPPPPAPAPDPPMEWIDGAAFVGGAVAAGWLLGAIFGRLY